MENNKRVAWITGGGTGIGLELTKILIKNNWKVAISGRRIEKLKKTQEIDVANISVFKLDITSRNQCQLVKRKIVSRFKKIDLVILNAAAYNPGHLNFDNVKDNNNVINTNLIGQMNCVSSILPMMKKKNSGHIVFISSPAGFRGLPNAGIYGITKSALTFLAESLNLELINSKIKIQVVHPGFVKTPMTDKNKFPMPFLMEANKAALIIFNKLSSSCFEIYFPKRLILPMKFLNVLPYKLYFFIMNKILKISNNHSI